MRIHTGAVLSARAYVSLFTSKNRGFKVDGRPLTIFCICRNRCLIALCYEDKLDPGVEWTVDRRKKSLGAELFGRHIELHDIWSEAKNDWDQRHRDTAVNTLPPTESDEWYKDYEPEAIALGLAVATAGFAAAAAAGVVSISNMPIVAVGRAIWEVRHSSESKTGNECVGITTPVCKNEYIQK